MRIGLKHCSIFVSVEYRANQLIMCRKLVHLVGGFWFFWVGYFFHSFHSYVFIILTIVYALICFTSFLGEGKHMKTFARKIKKRKLEVLCSSGDRY